MHKAALQGALWGPTQDNTGQAETRPAGSQFRAVKALIPGQVLNKRLHAQSPPGPGLSALPSRAEQGAQNV